MAEPLCDLSGGEIRSAPLAAILVEALRTRATGELRVDARGGTSRVYFRRGQPCGAQVFFGGFKPLGQFLLEEGWIDIEALDRSLAAVVEGRKQGEALVDLGYLTREKLKEGLSRHHQRHIHKLAEVSEGVYAFTALAELPAWTDELQLSGHRAIVDALSTAPGRQVGQRILGRVPPSLGLRLRSGWERYAGHFQLDPEEQAFLETLERPQAVGAAVGSGVLQESRTHALVSALYLMGVLVPAPLGDAGPWITPGPPMRGTPGPVLGGTPGPSAARHWAGRPAAAHTDDRTPGPRIGVTARTNGVQVEAPIASSPVPHGAERAEAGGRALEIDLGALGEPAPDEKKPTGAAETTLGPGRAAFAQAQEPAGDVFAEHAQGPAGAAFAEVSQGPGHRAGATPPPPPPDAIEAEEGRRTTPPPPPPDAREDEPALGRRARMIHRALERIPGAEVLRRPETREAAGPEPLDWRSLPEPGEPGFEEMVRDRHARVRGLDHFSRLGLQRDAGRDEIKRAFFGAAKRFHPDRLPPAALPLKREIQAIFAALNESYQLLQDDQRRQRYLDELEGHSTGNHAVREFEAEVAAAFQRRDFATAQRILADALEIEERPDLRAHLLWARQSERPELTAQVREELGRLVAQHERCASAHYYLGVLARVAGETDVADRRFRAVLDILPTHREAQRELELLALRRAEPQRPRRW